MSNHLSSLLPSCLSTTYNLIRLFQDLKSAPFELASFEAEITEICPILQYIYDLYIKDRKTILHDPSSSSSSSILATAPTPADVEKSLEVVLAKFFGLLQTSEKLLQSYSPQKGAAQKSALVRNGDRLRWTVDGREKAGRLRSDLESSKATLVIHITALMRSEQQEIGKQVQTTGEQVQTIGEQLQTTGEEVQTTGQKVGQVLDITQSLNLRVEAVMQMCNVDREEASSIIAGAPSVRSYMLRRYLESAPSYAGSMIDRDDSYYGGDGRRISTQLDWEGRASIQWTRRNSVAASLAAGVDPVITVPEITMEEGTLFVQFDTNDHDTLRSQLQDVFRDFYMQPLEDIRFSALGNTEEETGSKLDVKIGDRDFLPTELEDVAEESSSKLDSTAGSVHSKNGEMDEDSGSDNDKDEDEGYADQDSDLDDEEEWDSEDDASSVGLQSEDESDEDNTSTIEYLARQFRKKEKRKYSTPTALSQASDSSSSLSSSTSTIQPHYSWDISPPETPDSPRSSAASSIQLHHSPDPRDSLSIRTPVLKAPSYYRPKIKIMWQNVRSIWRGQRANTLFPIRVRGKRSSGYDPKMIALVEDAVKRVIAPEIERLRRLKVEDAEPEVDGRV